MPMIVVSVLRVIATKARKQFFFFFVDNPQQRQQKLVPIFISAVYVYQHCSSIKTLPKYSCFQCLHSSLCSRKLQSEMPCVACQTDSSLQEDSRGGLRLWNVIKCCVQTLVSKNTMLSNTTETIAVPGDFYNEILLPIYKTNFFPTLNISHIQTLQESN